MRNYTFVDYATQAYQVMTAGLILLFHNGTVDCWSFRVAAHLAAIFVVHGLIQWNATRPNAVFNFLRHFYPVLFYTWFFNETGHLNRMFFDDYLDPVFIRWDQAIFGFQPSVEFMNALPSVIVSELFYASYFSYYLMISGIGLALYLRSRPQFFHFVSVVSFVFYVCYTIYIFLPVIGPRTFFREVEGYSLPAAVLAFASSADYPAAVQQGLFYRIMAWIYHQFESPGAAMPSSHVAVALTTLYFSFKYLPRLRWWHLVMVVLLCFSTVYCRYHYVVDIAAGVLTAVLLVPAGDWLYLRMRRPELESGEGTDSEVPPAGKMAPLRIGSEAEK